MNEKKLKLTQEEVQALKKLIHFIKYECSDYDSTFFAASKLINSILDKVLEIDAYGSFQKKRYKEVDKELMIEIIHKLNKHIDFRKLDINSKLNFLKHILYPYEVEENQLMKYIE